MRYEDFVIQLGPDDGDGHSVRVLKSPAGEGAGRFRSPVSPQRMRELRNDAERALHLRGASRLAPTAETRDVKPGAANIPPADLRAVGAQLFEALFSGQVRHLYDRSLGAIAASADVGLRIKLKLDPGEMGLGGITGLPWELLYQEETDDALSLSRRSPLVRYLDVPQPVQPIPLPGALRVLVVISAPLGLAPLDLERERQAIGQAWGQQGGVEVSFLPRATPSALRKALLEAPFHVLHFMGHGGFDAESGEGVVYFENADGSAHPTSGRSLVTQLKDFDSLGLVFLNACETARAPDGRAGNPFSGVAGALVRGGLPAVVAMQFPISDRAAIHFSSAFYRRLAAGDSVDEALTEGRQAVHAAEPESMEWGTPVLFVRVPDGTVFQRPARSPGSRGRFVGATASVLTLLLTMALVTSDFFREPQAPGLFAAGEAIPVEIDHLFATNAEGLTGRLANIEVLANGRMRLNFEFTNTTERDLDLDFHNGRTYLADDFGNRYEVLPADPAVTPSASPQEIVPAGGVGSYSLEFPAPRQGTKVLNVGLEPTAENGAARPEFFQVDIADKLPEESFQAPEPIEEPAGARIQELEGAVFASDVEGFEGTVARVELRDHQTMRWKVEFFNRSEEEQRLGLRYDRIYLADELGNRYPVLRSSQHAGGEAVNAFAGPVQRAVRVDHWLDFPAPIGGARRFTLYLAGTESSLASFRSYTVKIDRYDQKRYSRPPARVPSSPSLETWSFDRPFDNSLAGLESRLVSVQLLESGRTRWNLRLLNRSEETLSIGFNFAATYLTDVSGQRYAVVGTNSGTSPDRAVEARLEPRLRSDSWLEFPTPWEGAIRFKLRLVSHDERRLRYAVTEIGPLTYPADFRPAPRTTREFATGSEVLAIEHAFPTGVEGLKARLAAIELLESGRMRWHIELRNDSRRDLRVGFEPAGSILRDRLGYEYRLLSASASQPHLLQRFLRADPWLEFAGPRDGAQQFVAELAAGGDSELAFEPFEVVLPEYSSRGAQVANAPPAAGEVFVLREDETPLATTVEGLAAKLTTVARVSNGRLRWHVEIHNGTGRALEIGFDHGTTFLTDNLGNRYRLLASDTNAKPDEVRKPYRSSLAPGRSTDHWFEFSGPIQGANRFIFVLGSHDPASLRFLPVQRDFS